MPDQFQEVLQNNPLLQYIYLNAKANAIMVMDEDGYILALNEAFQHAYGYTPDDLRGLHARVLFTEEDQKALMPEMEIEQVKQHGFSLDRNYLVHHDGTCIWVSGESVYTKDNGGNAFLIKITQNIHEQKLMEKFLKESQEFSESVVSSIRDGILVIDFEMKILKINQCFVSMFDFEGEKVEGKHLYEVDMLFAAANELNDKLQQIVSGSNFEKFDLQWAKEGATAKTLHVKASLLDGKLVNKKILLVFSDITKDRAAHKVVQESEQRFRFLIEAMPQKVWTADAGGYRDFFNQHWLEYTGLTLEELKGDGWKKVIHPDDLAPTETALASAIRTGTDFIYENRLLNKEGVYRWHLVRGKVHRNEAGNAVMWIGTNTDIHDQKMLEEVLELRVNERTEALQRSNAQLERSNQELEQFAFISTHDLQEPLREMMIFSNLLQSKATDKLNDAEQEYLLKIQQSAQRMRTLITDVLDFSRLNHAPGGLQYKPVDLNVVLSEVLADLEITIADKKAEIAPDNLPVIEAIELQMHQLLFNLLSNSLKFQQKNISPVIHIVASGVHAEELEAYGLDKDKQYTKLEFKDNGIGFNNQSSSRIFDFFQRLHAKETYPGTGIGLAICKKVVANHRGAIFAKSREGDGACFTVVLPVKQEVTQN